MPTPESRKVTLAEWQHGLKECSLDQIKLAVEELVHGDIFSEWPPILTQFIALCKKYKKRLDELPAWKKSYEYPSDEKRAQIFAKHWSSLFNGSIENKILLNQNARSLARQVPESFVRIYKFLEQLDPDCAASLSHLLEVQN